MCGINGFVSNSKKNIQDLIIMNNEIIHRGPDDDGLFFETKNDISIAMGMRRLSIIDLSTGKQPIFSSDNQKVIVFNGEIYNYKVLKQEHLRGYNFKSNSDTEVIIALYEKYGIASFAMLDGMFAFSIYDKTINKVLIARDFFGEKPLYYSLNGDSFYWCSELKSMLKVLTNKPIISIQGLNIYFQLNYIPAPYTIYESILKLEANHYLELDCDSLFVEIKEIKQNTNSDYSNLSKQEAIRINHDLVNLSVENRSISDVPIGTFLSGGVDSSIVSLCLAQQSNKKIETFSVGFDKKSFDETDKSKLVAKLINSNHHEFILSENDLAENIEKIVLNFDEPFADSSALPTFFIANRTKESVSVALTGDGGDEVYGGYNKYYMGRMNLNYTAVVPKRIHNFSENIFNTFFNLKDDKRGMLFKAKRFMKAVNYDNNFYLDIISLGFLEKERKDIINNTNYFEEPLSYYNKIIGSNNKSLTDFRNIDRLISLEGDLLVKVDRAAMLTSLECRAPFLNKELWKFTSSVPESYLINNWDKKHLLKESFKQYFPKDFLNKSKKGFGVPVGDWLRGILKTELLMFIEKRFIEDQNIFNYEAVLKLVNNHLEGKVDNTFRVWTYYCFQKWYAQIHI